MGKASGKSNVRGGVTSASGKGVYTTDVQKLSTTATGKALLAGASSIGGAIAISNAAIEDMLVGNLTPQQANIVNKQASLTVKGCSLFLRYGRQAADLDVQDPDSIPE